MYDHKYVIGMLLTECSNDDVTITTSVVFENSGVLEHLLKHSNKPILQRVNGSGQSNVFTSEFL